MKVLFLDIDGVLNGQVVRGEPMIWPRCVAELNRVLRETKCDVVLSSAWRVLVKPDLMTLRGFAWMLKTHGVILHGDLIGVTEQSERPRWEQIARWVAEHAPEQYAAVDDGNLDPLLRAVQTDYRRGLMPADADRLIERLK